MSLLTDDDLINLERNRVVAARDSAMCDPERLARAFEDYRQFYEAAREMLAEWKGLYYDDLAPRLSGKRVLDLGGGVSKDALLLASFGAIVTSIDIAEETGAVTRRAAQLLGIEARIDTICVDVCRAEFPPRSFDFILGNRILHHLTHNQEAICLRRSADWVVPDGEVRFFENAENNTFIDNVRWLIPMSGRPSSLSRRAFAAYKQINPSHPSRSNNYRHYLEYGRRYFEDVRVMPIGGLERFHRLFADGSNAERVVRKFGLRLETLLPFHVRLWIARRQTIICRKAKWNEYC